MPAPPPGPAISPWHDKLPASPSQHAPSLSAGQYGQLNPVLTRPPTTTGSGGQVSVNTDAMQAFASNIDALLPMVQDAWQTLQAPSLRPVAAGSFPEAYQINRKVNTGGTSTTDLVDSYSGVLLQCYYGLRDLRDAIKNLTAKYTTADERNKMSATELTNDLAPASGDFNQMMTDNGPTGGGAPA